MREAQWSEVPAPPSAERVWNDLKPVLDEEVNRLPAKYRQPFVLCHMLAQTNQHAAYQLGCPVGTVLSRLSRARARLRDRLARRGVALSAATLVAVVGERASAATIPVTIADATARAAISFAAGSGAVTAAPVALARGYLSFLFWSKMAVAAGCVLALGVTASVGPSAVRWVREEYQTAVLTKLRDADQALLQGSWRLVSSQFGGQTVFATNSRYVFEGDQCTVFDNGQRVIGKTCTLDPSQTPKAIDVVTERGVKLWGIYSFAGNSLMFCLTPSPTVRPTDFVTRPDSDWLVIVLSRE